MLYFFLERNITQWPVHQGLRSRLGRSRSPSPPVVFGACTGTIAVRPTWVAKSGNAACVIIDATNGTTERSDG